MALVKSTTGRQKNKMQQETLHILRKWLLGSKIITTEAKNTSSSKEGRKKESNSD